MLRLTPAGCTFGLLVVATVAALFYTGYFRQLTWSFQNHGSKREHRLIKMEDNATMVMILSYMRSGTSMMGKLFDVNDDALYVFEPMWYLCIVAVPGYKPLSYLNGTKWYPPPSCTEQGLKEAESYLTCKISDITKGSLSQFWMMSARKTNKFYWCGLSPNCVRNFTRICQNSSIRALKALHLSIDDVVPLLRNHRNLKIIHLVRDPRGIIQSRIPNKEYYYYSPLITGSEICGQMLRNVLAFARVASLYRDQLLQIRYEDFAEDPMKYTEKIYSFLKASLPEKVRNWVRENTNAEVEDGLHLGTARRNSATTSYKWRSRISWDIAIAMDAQCSRVYRSLGYIKVHSENMLRNLSKPLKRN